MNTCTHTYALLNLIWCDLIRYCNTYLPIHFNRTFRPASLYKHHAFQQVFLQYPLSVNNNKIWQRCTPHGMASMDDESSDSPHRQKKKTGRVHIPQPASASAYTSRDMPNEKKAMTTRWRHTRPPESGRRGEMSSYERASEKENALHLPACPHYRHSCITYNATRQHALNHSWVARATTLSLTSKPFSRSDFSVLLLPFNVQNRRFHLKQTVQIYSYAARTKYPSGLRTMNTIPYC
jgi:hypothetical protein